MIPRVWHRLAPALLSVALLSVALLAGGCGDGDGDGAAGDGAAGDGGEIDSEDGGGAADARRVDDGEADDGEAEDVVTTATTDDATDEGSTVASTGDDDRAGTGAPPASFTGELVPEVIASHPHDRGAFTQGLEWYGDRLVESTGLRGQSSLRLVDPTTGRVEEEIEVADELFAEGVTVVDGRALQLTWQNETLLTTDLGALGDPAATVRTDQAYDGQGWGLCFDDSRLVMSDGSSQLTFRDPATFEPLGRIEVTDDGDPVTQLNELECVGNQVWANVWQSNRIVAIDAGTGTVQASVDASALVPDGVTDTDSDNVLNGIAYADDTGRFWLTGKRWPVLYEVELVPAGEG